MRCAAGRWFWDTQQLDRKILPHLANLDLPIVTRAGCSAPALEMHPDDEEQQPYSHFTPAKRVLWCPVGKCPAD